MKKSIININNSDNVTILIYIKQTLEILFPHFPNKKSILLVPMCDDFPQGSVQKYNRYHIFSNKVLSFTMFIIFSLLSVFTFIKDDYITFLISNIDNFFKKVDDKSIHKCYEEWKLLFVKRIYYKFIIKICFIFCIIVTMMFMNFKQELTQITILLSITSICAGFIYLSTYAYNDRIFNNEIVKLVKDVYYKFTVKMWIMFCAIVTITSMFKFMNNITIVIIFSSFVTAYMSIIYLDSNINKEMSFYCDLIELINKKNQKKNQ